MVLAYLGLERSEAEVNRMLGAREFGTPSFAVRLAAWAEFGYRAATISPDT